MKRLLLPSTLLMLLLSFATAADAAAAAAPRPEILGVRLGMAQKEAHLRLKQLGTLDHAARKRQEVWKVKDPRFTHLLVGFDKQGSLRYVTAVARPKGRKVRYSEVADPKTATRSELPGNVRLTWQVKAKDSKPGYVVTARGTQATHLDTWSVKQLE